MSGKRRCGVGVWASMGLNVSSALPRRWLRVKQVAWRWDRGLLVRFLAVGCGLNSRLAAGWGLGDAELLEFACDFEGNLESLLVVEPWVDVGLVGFTEV